MKICRDCGSNDLEEYKRAWIGQLDGLVDVDWESGTTEWYCRVCEDTCEVAEQPACDDCGRSTPSATCGTADGCEALND